MHIKLIKLVVQDIFSTLMVVSLFHSLQSQVLSRDRTADIHPSRHISEMLNTASSLVLSSVNVIKGIICSNGQLLCTWPSLPGSKGKAAAGERGGSEQL